MSYTELESGYQDLRQSSQQAQCQSQSFSNERSTRPGFFVGSDGNVKYAFFLFWYFYMCILNFIYKHNNVVVFTTCLLTDIKVRSEYVSIIKLLNFHLKINIQFWCIFAAQ